MLAMPDTIELTMYIVIIAIVTWFKLHPRGRRTSPLIAAPRKTLAVERASRNSTSASLPTAISSDSSSRSSQKKAVTSSCGVDVMCRNLPNRMTEEVMTSIVEKITSNFVSVIIPFDESTGANKGYGFVRLTDKAEALAFIEAIHGRTFVGVKINGSAIRSTKDLRAKLA